MKKNSSMCKILQILEWNVATESAHTEVGDKASKYDLERSRNFVIYNVKFQGKKLWKTKETGLNCPSTFPNPLSNEAVCCT